MGVRIMTHFFLCLVLLGGLLFPHVSLACETIQLSYNEIVDSFAKTDANNDDSISAEEYIATKNTQIDEGMQKAARAEPVPTADDGFSSYLAQESGTLFQQEFDQADQNKDKLLSFSEYQSAIYNNKKFCP